MFKCLKGVKNSNGIFFVKDKFYNLYKETNEGYVVLDEDNEEHTIGREGIDWFDEHFLGISDKEYLNLLSEYYAHMPNHDSEDRNKIQKHIDKEIEKATVPLIAALKFYADRENYKIWDDIFNNCPTSSVIFDDGYRAREALKIEH